MSEDAAPLRIEATAEGLAIWIHVTPRSRTAGVGGLHGDALRVRVNEPPLKGRANAACTKLLADALGVKPRDVLVRPGSTGRRKRVEILGEAHALRPRLTSLALSP